MRSRTSRFVALVLLAGAGPAQAAPAGFLDCDKAEKADEKAICASPSLIQEDARMTTLYQLATGFAGMGTRGELQDGQVQWLESRHGCGDDVACLRKTYAGRISRLQKVIDAVTARGPF